MTSASPAPYYNQQKPYSHLQAQQKCRGRHTNCCNFYGFNKNIHKSYQIYWPQGSVGQGFGWVQCDDLSLLYTVWGSTWTVWTSAGWSPELHVLSIWHKEHGLHHFNVCHRPPRGSPGLQEAHTPGERSSLTSKTSIPLWEEHKGGHVSV